MPNKNYQPNQPEYYSFKGKFPILSDLLGTRVEPTNEEEREVFKQNPENLKAYLRSQMMNTPTDPADIEKSLGASLPGYDPNRPDRAERRQLSQDARDQIAEVGAQLWNVKHHFSTERLNYMLLKPGNTQEIQDYNKMVIETMEKGTPEAKGKLIEERVQSAKEWFNRCQNGLSDRELVDNLMELHLSHDLVVNAQVILADAKEGKLALSEEVIKDLKYMELHSTEMDIPKQRVRAIANPCSEYLDVDVALQMDNKDFDRALDKTEEQEALNDFLFNISFARSELRTGIKSHLYELMEQDMALNAETPEIKVVGASGDVKTHKYDTEPRHTSLDEDLGNSYALVTAPSGAAACYKIEKDGKVERATAQQMQEDLVQRTKENVKDALKDVDDANKGFFIGSRAYSSAHKSIKNLFETMETMGNPPSPEEMEKLKPLLQNVVEKCEAYMQTKDPNNFKNDRERSRYEAIQRASEQCRKGMSYQQLQEDAAAAEREAALNFHSPANGVEFPSHNQPELRNKVHTTYDEAHVEGKLMTGKVVDTRIPASSVGDIADQLRASVKMSLDQVMLQPDNFDAQDARNIMSNMVVLEMVKKGRSIEGDQIIAGDVEKALAEDPGKLIQSVRDNAYFQQLTENVTPEMLRHFVMTDGAATMADNMLRRSVQLEQQAEAEKNLENQKEMTEEKVTKLEDPALKVPGQG